uniref:ATP synthase F0 subunit 6 n=1 Tax=Eoneureclipsis hainanensis TaxID=3043990 RepID=UPI002551FCDF|nr:ATP synthase F0 subunit 6 [Eoneureclipsis hainanensis]WGT74386.1 ATP synthase F0 subunit 6 [Eoneureclipsis hainanensis]
MMNNLFSIFDPSTMFFFPLNWMSSILLIIILPLNFWFLPNKLFMMIWKMITYLQNEIKIIINNNNLMIFFIAIFFFIVTNNFMGLFPYIFTSTSHLCTNLTISLPFWLAIMMFGWINNMNHMFTHLVPQGTPLILMPFMVMIETISNIIRPLTLAVRLTANMIAGHLLMSLLSSMKNSFPTYSIFILTITQITLMILEMSVAFIQAYVFTILMSLYSSETN